MSNGGNERRAQEVLVNGNSDLFHPERIITPATYNQDAVAGNVKWDAKKIRMELLPARALWDVAKVMTHGAKKYAPDNWRRRDGSSTQRYLGSMMRHLNAIQRGEDFDPDTGLLHAAHMACNALFILEAQLQGLWNDDRTKDAAVDVYQNVEQKWQKE